MISEFGGHFFGNTFSVLLDFVISLLYYLNLGMFLFSLLTRLSAFGG